MGNQREFYDRVTTIIRIVVVLVVEVGVDQGHAIDDVRMAEKCHVGIVRSKQQQECHCC